MSKENADEKQKANEKELEETKPEVLLEVIDTYIEIREYEKALCILQDVLNIYEKSDNTVSNEKIVYHLKNAIKTVSELIGQDMSQVEQVLEIAEEPLLLFNLACLFSLHKQKTKATRALNRAISLRPLIKEMASEEKTLKNIF